MRPRSTYVRHHSFELATAIGSIIASVLFALKPRAFEQTAVGAHSPHALAVFWAAGFLFGGIGVLVGLLRPSARMEVAALAVWIGALFANGAAVLIDHGISGAVTAATDFGIALGGCGRIALLLTIPGLWKGRE